MVQRWVSALAIIVIVILASATALLAYEYQQQQNTISRQSTQISNLGLQIGNQSQMISRLNLEIQNLTGIVNRHGSELLANMSGFTVGPATPSVTGPGGVVYSYSDVLESLGNFSFPYDGYVVVSVTNSNYSGQDNFFVNTDWKGAGGEVLVAWNLHSDSYKCANGVPLPCPPSPTSLNIPARLVLPVISGSTLSIIVQNPEPNTLSTSIAVEYEY